MLVVSKVILYRHIKEDILIEEDMLGYYMDGTMMNGGIYHLIVHQTIHSLVQVTNFTPY